MDVKKTTLGLILLAAATAIFLFLPATRPVVVSLKNPSDAQQIERDYKLSDFREIISNEQLGHIYKAQISKNLYSRLSEDSRISYVEQDYEVSASQLQITPVTTANDPFFTTDPLFEDRQWYLPKVRIPQAWNYSRGSSDVVVAIIDTGIHASHLDLNDGRIIAGYNALTDQPIPMGADSDDNGHGTAMAGVIGAIPNNQKGIAGINWNVSLMPVKALNFEGEGEISVISAGIIWAADHGADIINLSLGGSGFPNNITMANAISYAYSKGVLIVAAAGNDTASFGKNLDTDPVYPVCADNGQNMIIGVAASDINDRKANFSNFGINCIDITAPGSKILTTAFLPSDPSDNILIYASGTSLATPVVAGVAALMKAQDPSLSNIQIRDRILKTAHNIDSLNQDDCLNSSCNGFLGKGRIDALLAVQPQPILNETLVREASSGNIYLISGGTKHYVSPFVLKQKYAGREIFPETGNQLTNYPMGTAISPNTGTLVKGQTDPTVYYIDNGVRRPLTYLVFVSRNFSFADVQVLSEPDLAVIPLADWYWPPNGTLVLIKGDPTVYVMDQGVARPVTYFVFIQRKLSFGNVITVTRDEFSHVPRPADSYWLAPLAGTLVKSPSDATVYVIENGMKRPLSGRAFAERDYKFSVIKTLPQAEMDVIAPGEPIF